MRNFLEADDGQPFYTVNLYEYYAEANYSDTSDEPVTGREAYDRFSQVMLKLLARHGSHPIFASDWVAPEAANSWHRIVIVRYRSRRDIIDIFASDEFAEASADKWAALKNNERMLVQGLHIPGLMLPTIFLILITGLFSLLRLWVIAFMGNKNTGKRS